MTRVYAYKLRPAYGSTELLIEFTRTGDIEAFVGQLLQLLQHHGFECNGTADVWMNDEAWIYLKSEKGQVLLTKDIWDMVFILGKDHQTAILKIDEILMTSELYEKEPVDFKDYTLKK